LSQEPKDIKQRLEDALDHTAQASHARSIAVARRDGLVIVHRLAPGLDPRLTAAMAAAMLGAAASAAKELRQGEIERVIVECTGGTIVAVDAGPDAIVVALYDRGANLGLALHGLARAAQSVDQMLAEL
jgi:predicted regulator of Ras-like GTPase activity (Roadblock/LC7/MglB family)